jgi:hypothetical protein
LAKRGCLYISRLAGLMAIDRKKKVIPILNQSAIFVSNATRRGLKGNWDQIFFWTIAIDEQRKPLPVLDLRF